MYMYARWLVLFVLFATAAPVEAQVLTFQQGVGGYTGGQHAQLHSAAFPDTPMNDNGGGNLRIDNVDNGGIAYVLLRFENIFGTGAGQIPLGSPITSAILTLQENSDGTNQPLDFHRMVQPWTVGTATWNFFGNGIDLNGTEAIATPDGTRPTTMPALVPFDVDVTTSLRAWSAGASNQGWHIRIRVPADGVLIDDGLAVRSNLFGTLSERPLLTVAIPEPGVLLLAGLGMGTLGLTGYRRRRAKPADA
jgi:hypothetical protein